MTRHGYETINAHVDKQMPAILHPGSACLIFIEWFKHMQTSGSETVLMEPCSQYIFIQLDKLELTCMCC